jgi:ABC-type phosphate transport system substrate-binding protein
MLKKLLGVIGTSAAVFAAGNASAGALGAPNEIFIGGATAVQETFHLDIMLRFCAWDGNTNNADGVRVPQVFVDDVLTKPGAGDGSTALPSLKHKSEQVTYCTFKSSLSAGMAGKDVAVYKYNGGSGTGVAPVADPVVAPAADQGYLDASTTACTQVIPTSNPGPGNTFLSVDGVTRFELWDCPSTRVTQAPDGGISDVEPKMFVGQLATGYGTSVPGISPDKPQNDFVDKGNLVVKPGPGIVFGVIVSTAMYDELTNDQQVAGLLPDCPASPTRAQRDSLACMPSLPTALVQSAMTGEISKWTTRSVYGQALSPPAYVSAVSPLRGADGDKINICRRTAGSGTHAQFMAHYLRTNCINNSPSIKTFGNDYSQFFPLAQVYENEGSSDIDKCMNALNSGSGYNGGFAHGLTTFPGIPTPADGGKSSVVPQGRTAYAIGYNSLERNNALDQQYRFVKIDGVAPTLENAYNGNYQDVYYLSYQNRVIADGVTPDPRLGAIRTVAADATETQVIKEFFDLWHSPTAAAVDAVNDGLIVNPDGILGNADDWQGGLLTPDKLAPAAWAGGPDAGNDPRTPWARQTAGGVADSCQNLSIKN